MLCVCIYNMVVQKNHLYIGQFTISHLITDLIYFFPLSINYRPIFYNLNFGGIAFLTFYVELKKASRCVRSLYIYIYYIHTWLMQVLRSRAPNPMSRIYPLTRHAFRVCVSASIRQNTSSNTISEHNIIVAPLLYWSEIKKNKSRSSILAVFLSVHTGASTF
jgi:hypothetical protein